MSQVPESLHLHIQDGTLFPSQGAWVRFQQQLPCSWLCVNEPQPAAKIMLRGPKKLKWGLLSTWLTFPVSSRHILLTSCVISTESDKRFRDSHFPLIIKMNLLKNVGRIHCTSAGSLRVWGPSGDNHHRFQKSPLRLISTYLSLIWKLTCNKLESNAAK